MGVRLTPREQDVLKYVLAGMTSKAIAQELGLSKRTVDAHRAHIAARLGIRQAKLQESVLNIIKGDCNELSKSADLSEVREPSVLGE